MSSGRKREYSSIAPTVNLPSRDSDLFRPDNGCHQPALDSSMEGAKSVRAKSVKISLRNVGKLASSATLARAA